MKDIIDFFQNLFSTEGFMPRWICGRWTDFNGWIYITGDILTGTAYMAIPTMILKFAHGQKITHFRILYYLFPAFIILCGTTHLANMLMFWFPVYRLGGLLAVITGVVSWVTVAHIYKSLPFALSLTPRDKLEEEIILRKNAELQLRSNETKLLGKTNELEQKNEQLERFAYIASHDLMEPLRKINMFADRLETSNKDVLNSQGREYLAKLKDASARMEMLMKGILEYSRINEITFAPVDLKLCLQHAIDILEIPITESGANIVIKGQFPTIEGVEQQLQQVFTNLVSNAIKFRKPGVRPEVHISCDVKSGRELEPANSKYLGYIGNQLEKKSVRIHISDNGIGFDPAYEEKVFDLFQRLHDRKSVYEGTGIGLSIVKRVIDLHHGWVRAESKEGVGSTFIVILPMDQENDDQRKR